MVGRDSDFRIDPAVVHELMGNRVPKALAPGTEVEVVVDRTQLASPVHPLANPTVGIVWVHGLAINGITQFTLDDALRREAADNSVGYWMLAAGAVLWAGSGLCG